MSKGKLKFFLIFIGDCLMFYVSLIIVLFFRYGIAYKGYLLAHTIPFLIVLCLLALIFYITDLYSDRFIKHGTETWRVFFYSICTSLIISILCFYIFGNFFKLTPKTNLLLFWLIFFFLDYVWRFYFGQLIIKKGWQKHILFIGNSAYIQELVDVTQNNPAFGYDAKTISEKFLFIENFESLKKEIDKNKIGTVIIDTKIKNRANNIKSIYKLIPFGIEIIDSRKFYEKIFNKISLEDIDEEWLIENITTGNYVFSFLKRCFDLFFSIILFFVTLPIFILTSVLVKISSKGPIIFKQLRAGKNDKSFVLYKFRTMKTGQNGPLWTENNDGRLTKIGKFLHQTHFDELPQLFNIIRGEISFVGPRAERIELAKTYAEIPYYEIRHIVKPGLTGWAQLYYKASTSTEEAKEKLKYDLYYIKNRSFLLDILITLKTIRMFFFKN